jgi:threonine/homoserine/homoserine lactone efflux protein
MNAATLAVFALVALVAIATPGPTVLLALANGSRHGVRRSLPGRASWTCHRSTSGEAR